MGHLICHNGDLVLETEGPVTKAKVRQYCCRVCGKVFLVGLCKGTRRTRVLESRNKEK